MADIYNTYNSSYSGEQLEQMVNFVNTQIAEPFDSTKAYNAEDFVMYKGFLYSAKTDLDAGAFNASDWIIQKIFDNNGIVAIK